MITIDFKKLRIKPGYKILDIGCGAGRHTTEAYRYEKTFAVGVDRDFNNVSETINRLQYHDKLNEHGGGVWGAAVGDILELPFKDNFFDAVICSEVMEHIKDDKIAAKELIRVLKPENFLAISVPRYLPERICWFLSDSYRNSTGGHVRIYGKKELVSVFVENGMKFEDSGFAHSLHTPYWWLKCLLGQEEENKHIVKLYHRFLVWDIMKKPKLTRFFERLLNPIFGKSSVFYFKK